MGDLDDTVASPSGTSLLGFILAEIDANAILVLNTRGVRVGYLKATAARVLAPLIDSQLIFVEAIVPRVPRVRKLIFVESQIHVVARVADFEHVKSAILRGNLMLIPPAGKEVRSVDKSFTLVGRNVRKKAKPEALEPPTEIIMTHLLEHQKQELGWLVHMENTGELPPKSLSILRKI
ncbi:putative SWI/SNF-related matrix-associated actin-dependent regulator of chromatin subfamily A member 3-like 1 [Syzygium oleosum]|uniref:putative SWI/SNF-related matrix-associated actin-dependent regulator of chromatin subfamily A member 3-like 1 n=1 Tax=Syzygium oleosum TaxID=219896 RepID=UPI0024BAE319|nr:putative SWI/SNF-related matrix-associated actin-dependent regulator of chromatin subfamily A member 3-like 1 [Syzygium oleosum]